MSSEVKLTYNPALFSVGSPWTQAPDSVFKPANAFQSIGMMPVQLPDKSTVKSLRVTGNTAAPNLNVGLLREAVTTVSAPEAVVVVDNPPLGDFDETVKAPKAPIADVDNGSYRYYLQAGISVSFPLDVMVGLYAFQITCDT